MACKIFCKEEYKFYIGILSDVPLTVEGVS